MSKLMGAPPYSLVEPVTEILHGVTVTDPYRWLEDQNSPQTRAWLDAQTQFARSYLDEIPGRERIRERIRELLDVETYDSIQKVGQSYFFRKRVVGQEQPCIFLREGGDGEDCLLLDPSDRGTGPHTALKPICVSPDGRLLLYEVKEGGERTGTFEILDIASRVALPDGLSRGCLRGFAFAPDSQSFYYVHEPIISNKPNYRAVFQHTLGNSFIRDREIFFGGESDKVRLCIQGGTTKLAFILYSFSGVTRTSCYFLSFDSGAVVQTVVEGAEYNFLPIAIDRNKTLAITDRDAPNMRVVEVSLKDPISEFVDVIPPSDALIQNVAVTRKYIVASYNRRGTVQIAIYDHSGIPVGKIPVKESETVRVLASSVASDEIWIERESFTEPIQQYVYSSPTSPPKLWTKRKVPFASEDFDYIQVRYTGMDGEIIPMFLVGKRPILANGSHPTIMTSYGGFGVPMTPQFSVFVAYMMERDCLFALPNIRGGSEFGRRWHQAATRRNRQVAFDDFLGAAEWLIQTGRTSSDKLAIFGGSNSGLLVGAAMTQRPDLFRAVICMAPMLDMLRYHLFDNAHFWKEEFGTSEDKDDFGALLGYSPYHQVKPGTLYPATMIVSGDLDQNSNPLHARKMTARLQSANPAGEPILLDYGPHRGHAPVQPLSERVNALTDRMAFLCDRLHITE